MQDYIEKFKTHLIDYDKPAIQNLLNTSFFSNDLAKINQLFFNTLTEIGKEWEEGKISLSQIYMSGVLCEELINEKFVIDKNNLTKNPEIAIVTYSDYHTLGKKILYSQLLAAGYNVLDLGQNSNTDNLVQQCIDNKIKILLVSVLMLPSALKIKDLKSCFIKKNYNITIIAGGAPFNFDPTLCQRVEADDTGKTPADAMQLIDKWINNIEN